MILYILYKIYIIIYICYNIIYIYIILYIWIQILLKKVLYQIIPQLSEDWIHRLRAGALRPMSYIAFPIGHRLLIRLVIAHISISRHGKTPLSWRWPLNTA